MKFLFEDKKKMAEFCSGINGLKIMLENNILDTGLLQRLDERIRDDD